MRKKKRSAKFASGISNIANERKNILSSNTPFSTVEEYKALRANLMFSIADDGCKTIGITSAEATEGKSITCLNIALTFAEADKRVLIMDCDLRMPKISRLLGIPSTPGLSNVLVNMNSVDEAIAHVALNNTQIDVLRSGDIPPNPSELLGSAKMAALLAALSERYDYIFIDTPPLAVVSDAVVLSKRLSGLALVVRSGRTEQAAVGAALAQLEYANANTLGFILTGISDKDTHRFGKYKSYSSYYRYYGHTHSEDASQAQAGS